VHENLKNLQKGIKMIRQRSKSVKASKKFQQPSLMAQNAKLQKVKRSRSRSLDKVENKKQTAKNSRSRSKSPRNPQKFKMYEAPAQAQKKKVSP
jgi:hypothetical protein